MPYPASISWTTGVIVIFSKNNEQWALALRYTNLPKCGKSDFPYVASLRRPNMYASECCNRR